MGKGVSAAGRLAKEAAGGIRDRISERKVSRAAKATSSRDAFMEKHGGIIADFLERATEEQAYIFKNLLALEYVGKAKRDLDLNGFDMVGELSGDTPLASHLLAFGSSAAKTLLSLDSADIAAYVSPERCSSTGFKGSCDPGWHCAVHGSRDWHRQVRRQPRPLRHRPGDARTDWQLLVLGTRDGWHQGTVGSHPNGHDRGLA